MSESRPHPKWPIICNPHGLMTGTPSVATSFASWGRRDIATAAKTRVTEDLATNIMSKEDQEFWADLMEQIEV